MWHLRNTLTPEQRIIALKIVIAGLVVDRLALAHKVVHLSKTNKSMHDDLRFQFKIIKKFVEVCKDHGATPILVEVDREAEFQYVIKGLED